MKTSHKIAIGGGILALGWWLNRGSSTEVVEQEGANKLTADVGDDVNRVANDGVKIAGEVATGSTGKADLGGSSVIGDQGGTNPVVEFNGPCGESGLKVDHMAPSNAESSISSPNTPVKESHGGLAESPPAVWQGDLQETYMRATFGITGAQGLTKNQISRAYGELAAISGEVF